MSAQLIVRFLKTTNNADLDRKNIIRKKPCNMKNDCKENSYINLTRSSSNSMTQKS